MPDRRRALVIAALSIAPILTDAPLTRATGGYVPPIGRSEPIRSLLVVSPGAPVRTAPHGDAPRRGALARNERLAYMGQADGPGCSAPYFRVDAEGYVCGEYVEPRTDAPEASAHPPLPAPGEIMPWGYGYAGLDGSRVYRRAEDVEADLWESELDPGFGVAVRGTVQVAGARFLETLGGRLIPARELRLARPSRFSGAALESRDQAQRVGWVIAGEIRARARPGQGPSGALFARHDRVDIQERAQRGGHLYVRVGESAWLDARAIRQVRLADRPAGVADTERWIDVDLEQQIATAYEGDVPRYATLVSTGRRATPTPTGTFRIWVKLASSTMDNLEDDEADRYYSLDDVPWVLYFDRGVALHAAFWHDHYGERRSHGCVNLSPVDARVFFEFASPGMPAGWTASFPTPRNPGTLVRVRG